MKFKVGDKVRLTVSDSFEDTFWEFQKDIMGENKLAELIKSGEAEIVFVEDVCPEDEDECYFVKVSFSIPITMDGIVYHDEMELV